MVNNEPRTSQLGLVSGIQQTTSDMVLQVEPAVLFSPEARKGRLYILAETAPEPARGHDAVQVVLRTIRKVFYGDSSYSVTSSLRKAISAANHTLYQQNFNSPSQRRVVVGVTCAVLKDNDLYIAQIEPTQAYLQAEGKLRAMPQVVSWNSGQHAPAPMLKPASIGASLTVEAAFYRAVVRPNDRLLMCSSNLSRLLSQEDMQGLLRRPEASDITEKLREICDANALSDAQALVLAIHPALSEHAQAAPLSRSGVSERGRLLARTVGQSLGRVTGEAARLVRPKGHGEKDKTDLRLERAQREKQQMQTMPDEPPPLPVEPIVIKPLDVGHSLDEAVAQERDERNERLRRLGAAPERPDDLAMPPSAFLGEGSYPAPPAPGEPRIDLSDTPGMAAVSGVGYRPPSPPSLEPTVGERLTQPVTWISSTVQQQMRRRRLRRPPPSAMPRVRRRPGLSYRREGPPFPWLMLLLLVALVSVLVVYGRSQLQVTAEKNANDTLNVAEQAVADIPTAQDEATQLQKLEIANRALEQVRASGVITATEDNLQRFTAAERDYEMAQEAIQKLTYFGDLVEVGRHPQAAANIAFTSVVVPPPPGTITNTVAFESVYLLDTTGTVYRMPRNGGSVEPILKPSDIGLVGQPIGPVRAIAWREDNVVAVAQNDGGFTYCFRNGDAWNFGNLGGSAEWGRTVPINDKRFHVSTYGGNLYVWGALPGDVLRYRSGQFGDLYEPWIADNGGQKTDVSIDLAIDGNINLLQPDGSIQVYNANVYQKTVAPPQVDPKFDTATSFFVTGDGESGYFYLVDTLQERILQVEKTTGTVLQQMHARDSGPMRLNLLSTVYVDDSGARPQLYMINGSQLLRASLPDLPRPLRAAPRADASATAEATTTASPDPSALPQP